MSNETRSDEVEIGSLGFHIGVTRYRAIEANTRGHSTLGLSLRTGLLYGVRDHESLHRNLEFMPFEATLWECIALPSQVRVG